MAFEGQNSEKRPEKDKQCPRCKKKGTVYFTGSDVLHGNPYTPAADTDVLHYYRCENCGHQWSRGA